MKAEVGRRKILMGLALVGALVAAVAVWITSSVSEAEAQQKGPDNIVYGLTSDRKLVNFGSANPGNFRSEVAITGISKNEKIVGMDFRPINRKLYAVTDASKIYTIKPNSGAATRIATMVMEGGEPVELEGSAFGVDFNPMADALRIVSNTGQNLRVPMAGGADDRRVILMDTDLTYTEGASGDPRVSGAAYRNNIPNAPETELYDIDFSRDLLASQTPANDGTLQVVGDLGVDTSSVVGFDIAPKQGALAALKSQGKTSALYKVNLDTGRATSVGTLERNVLDIAIQLTMKPAQ